jgi:hypothetical protein
MKSTCNPIPEKILERILSNNFKQKGYQVINQCTDDPTKFEDILECKTHEFFGIDIVAQKDKELWVIEVKGQPKGGIPSSTTIMMAGVGQILTRIKLITNNIHYALAIPNTDCFAPSVRKFINSPIMSLLNLSLILIQDDGKIEFLR